MAKVKVSAGMVFERYEKKYRLPAETYLQLIERLGEYIQADQYGKHTICSLYFDAKDYLLIRRSIEKPNYKEKLRLRSYGIPAPDTSVYLELKKKLQGVTYKRRISMPYVEAQLASSRPTAGRFLKKSIFFASNTSLCPRCFCSMSGLHCLAEKTQTCALPSIRIFAIGRVISIFLWVMKAQCCSSLANA